MAKYDLLEAPLGGPAAKPLLKRRCHSDVSTLRQLGISFISWPSYLFIYFKCCTLFCAQHFCVED